MSVIDGKCDECGKTAKDYYLFCSQNSKTMKAAIAKAKVQ